MPLPSIPNLPSIPSLNPKGPGASAGQAKGAIRDVNAQCQVVWFPWASEFAGNPDSPNYAELSDSAVLDISAHLTSCTFTKNRGAAAGHFSFRLDNSRDWKKIMRPGQWCLIFMSNEGDLKLPTKSSGGEGFKGLPTPPKKDINKNRLRGMVYIERVAVNLVATENGVLDVIYEVSGRDYGVCYEETTIWYNYFQFEQLQVQKLADAVQYANQHTIKELLEVTHDLFYNPGKIIGGKTDSAELFGEVGVQWLLPRKMLGLIDVKVDGQFSFFGNIVGLKKFSKSISTIPVTDPLSYINGNAWQKLKEFSVKELHELFPELDDHGNPTLIFRPIPWAIDKKGYPTVAGALDKNLFYLNLAQAAGVSLQTIEIISANVGEDNHNRYNHFFTTSTASLGIPEANISLLKGQKSNANREFPNIQKGSIRRHGFRPMHVDVDSLGQFGGQDLGKRVLVEVNELIYDYWNNAIYFESGTFQIIGRNDIRVGKCLNIASDAPYNGDKIFYIEEYTDDFQVGDDGVTSWEQILTVSRGIDHSSLANLSGFARKAVDFKEVGNFVKG